MKKQLKLSLILAMALMSMLMCVCFLLNGLIFVKAQTTPINLYVLDGASVYNSENDDESGIKFDLEIAKLDYKNLVESNPNCEIFLGVQLISTNNDNKVLGEYNLDVAGTMGTSSKNTSNFALDFSILFNEESYISSLLLAGKIEDTENAKANAIDDMYNDELAIKPFYKVVSDSDVEKVEYGAQGVSRAMIHVANAEIVVNGDNVPNTFKSTYIKERIENAGYVTIDSALGKITGANENIITYTANSSAEVIARADNTISESFLANLNLNEEIALYGFTADRTVYEYTAKKVEVGKKDFGEIMYSTLDNTAVLPTEALKIVSEDENTIYCSEGNFDNTTTPQVTGREPISTSVKVLGENDVLLGTATLVSYTKVLIKDTDLAVLATAETHDGYYIVANDIKYTTDYEYHRASTSAIFAGIFDGNGKTIEFAVGGTGDNNAIPTFGLFNKVYSNDADNPAVVKNAMFIVKGFEATDNAAGKYSILGSTTNVSASTSYNSAIKDALISNVYCKYDTGSYAFDLAEKSDGTTRNNLGLFAATTRNKVEYENCILDLLSITLETDNFADNKNRLFFNVIANSGSTSNAGYLASVDYHDYYIAKGEVGLTVIIPDNLQPISDYSLVGYRANPSYNIAVFAANDQTKFEEYKQAMIADSATADKFAYQTSLGNASNQTLKNKDGTAVTSLSGYTQVAILVEKLFRYNSYADMNSQEEGHLGNFVITNDGITWLGSQD